MANLASYEGDVADLLHDPGNVIWSTTQLDGYINKARRKVVEDTGCLRVLQTVYFTQAQEQYTFGQVTGATIAAPGTGYLGTDTLNFSGGGGTGVAATLGVTSGAVTSITFTNFGSGYTSAPAVSITTGTGSGASILAGVINVNTYDVLDINLFWGGTRVQLDWKPFSVFSRLVRPFINLQARPVMWACYGENQIFLGPLPDQTYQAEVDSVVLPTDLSGATVDNIPTIYQSPIQYYAAHLAKFNQQSFGEAEVFLKKYAQRLNDVSNSYVRRITQTGNNV